MNFGKKIVLQKLIHFIGKDILYFHALFWPATLRAQTIRTPSKIFSWFF